MRLTVLILSFLFSIPALLSAQVNFNFSFYQTSGQGLAAVTADFNRDGYPDLAVGTNRAFEIFLSTNKGTSFGAPYSYLLPQDPQDMVAVDVNGDGWPDLAVLPSRGGKTVQVFLNTGNGTLKEGTPITLAAPAGYYISAGDVNNDGKVDLVMSETINNGSASQFAIYKGKGNGTFAAGQVIKLAKGASRPVVYDLNRDGKLDIATTDHPNAVVY